MATIDAAEGLRGSVGRRALVIISAAAMAGSMLGLILVHEGLLKGFEVALVFSCFIFAAASLGALLVLRKIPVQILATASTAYYAAYLCAGVAMAATESGHALHIFILLNWFFPLLVVNKLVNAPVTGRAFSKILRALPFLLILCLAGRLLAVLNADELALLAGFCMTYLGFGSALDIVTRHREEHLVERERVESHKAESELLESISDCFISFDPQLRLEYLNEAACTEFGVDRDTVMAQTLVDAVPGFLSEQMSDGLRVASQALSATAFEAPNRKEDAWYELRCFPRVTGISIFFRNITESVVRRRELEDAQERLFAQAELLNHVTDAILVAEVDDRIVYWNKGAERLYGWPAEDVIGQRVIDIFPDAIEDIRKCFLGVQRDGQWAGEFSHRRRDGSPLIVECRAAPVNGEDGKIRSILAIGTDVTSRRAAEDRIEQLAFYDPLTSLPNRYLLLERLEAAIATTVRDGGGGALLLVNLDDFSTPNDTLGHDLGDALLREAAVRIRGCIGEGDTVARLAGDEFLIVLEGLSEDTQLAANAARAIGDGVREAFRSPYNLGNLEYSGSVTVGAGLFAGSHHTVADLVSQVDLAMHRAKAQGRDAFCFFDPSMQTSVAARASLQSDLRRALQNREFELHYQPVVDGRGRVLGAEALLRWKHPVRGLVPPSEFIPLAEESGLITELDHWVLETACAQLAKWALGAQTRKLAIAVNVSLSDILDTNFVSIVLKVLQESGADPRKLRLEITESCAMMNAEDTIAKMTLLREHCVSFSIDDFGTGYSSLAHVKRLPLDILKVDRSFVSDALNDARSASIVRTIIALGRNLNLFVIAEGVETEEQRQFLEAEGCDGYQGFLFSPALEASKFEAFAAAQLPAARSGPRLA